MMGKSLTTPNDIVIFAGLPKDFPKCDLNRIRTVERKVFRDCIGNTLYNELLDSLADYSDAVQYKANETYTQGKNAVYNGVVYTALQDTDEPPTKKQYWEKAPRFDRECLETLWCEALGEYLAYSVLIPNLPLLLVQIRNGTMVRVAGKDMVVGDHKDLLAAISALEFFRDMAWDNLAAFVEDNNTDGCYDGFKTCCKRKKKHRGSWRVA